MIDSFPVFTCLPGFAPYASRIDPNAFLGVVPTFMSLNDPRPLAEQLDTGYAHGGGWCPMKGWSHAFTGEPATWEIEYPGDPPLRPVMATKFRDELLIVFPHAWFAIVTGEDKVQIARMD